MTRVSQGFRTIWSALAAAWLWLALVTQVVWDLGPGPARLLSWLTALFAVLTPAALLLAIRRGARRGLLLLLGWLLWLALDGATHAAHVTWQHLGLCAIALVIPFVLGRHGPWLFRLVQGLGAILLGVFMIAIPSFARHAVPEQSLRWLTALWPLTGLQIWLCYPRPWFRVFALLTTLTLWTLAAADVPQLVLVIAWNLAIWIGGAWLVSRPWVLGGLLALVGFASFLPFLVRSTSSPAGLAVLGGLMVAFLGMLWATLRRMLQAPLQRLTQLALVSMAALGGILIVARGIDTLRPVLAPWIIIGVFLGMISYSEQCLPAR